MNNKKLLFILTIIVWVLLLSILFITSCENGDSKSDSLEPKDELLNLAQGYWTKENYLGGIDFVCFSGEIIKFGTYEGASDRTGEINVVKRVGEKSFSVQIYYPALNDWFGENVPAKTEYFIMTFEDKKVTISGVSYSQYSDTYTYYGESIGGTPSISETSSDSTKEKSYIKPDTWYKYSSNNVVRAQNAEISSAVSTSKGQVFMINYYPVCSYCSVLSDRLEMTGVGIDTPVSEYYTCNDCDKITYVRFKIEY